MHTSLTNWLNNVLACMEENFFTPADFINHILGSTKLHYKNTRHSLTMKAVRICTALHREEHSHSHVTQWAITIVCDMLCTEVTDLSLEKHRLHFNTTSITAKQLESTSMHQLTEKMQRVVPNLWHLFFVLPDSTLQQQDLGEFGGDDIGGMMCEEDDVNEEADSAFEKQPQKCQYHAAERNAALLIIQRTVVMISICLQTSNSRCNLLQGWLGFFMRSACVPEKVVEVFTHAGLSISLMSTHNAVLSISKEISGKIKHKVRTLQAGFTYNNFNIQFKAAQPTLEHRGSFMSAMSATIIPLYGINNNNADALQSSAHL
ncbi:hypothetical protein BDR05DRAFT_888179 [Suillus weaverae]|nr:hypothetical protein BDR05DRAFT_888179 [Suillus weaverae]